MRFDWNCPNCARRVAADDSQAGSDIVCPKCSTVIVVPLPGSSDFQPYDPEKTKQPQVKRNVVTKQKWKTASKARLRIPVVESRFENLKMFVGGLKTVGLVIFCLGFAVAFVGLIDSNNIFAVVVVVASAGVFAFFMFVWANLIEVLLSMEDNLRRCADALEGGANHTPRTAQRPTQH